MPSTSASYFKGAAQGYTLEKEALVAAVAPFLPLLNLVSVAAMVGVPLVTARSANKTQAARHEEGLQALNKQRAALEEHARQTKRLRHTTTAAAGGAAIGSLSSNLWGKLNKSPSLRRDILSAIAGAGVGAVAEDLSHRLKKT
jgi:hypothetical protein